MLTRVLKIMVFFILLPPFLIAFAVFLLGVQITCDPKGAQRTSDRVADDIRKTRQQLTRDAAEQMRQRPRRRPAPAQPPKPPDAPEPAEPK